MGNIKKIGRIVEYIIHNNSIIAVPYRLWQAVLFQLKKRFLKTLEIKSLFNGGKIYLFPESSIASAFVYTAIPDKQEVLALRALLSQHRVFLDVGANIGAYSVLLQDKTQWIFAFEAHPGTAQLCRQNFMLNGLPADNVFSVAVSNETGFRRLTDQGKGHPANHQTTTTVDTLTVPTMTLDQFIETQGFSDTTEFVLKIDVEGFEHEVFQGAAVHLQKKRFKGIIFENFSPKQESILSCLRQLGYHITSIGQHNTLAILEQ